MKNSQTKTKPNANLLQGSQVILGKRLLYLFIMPFISTADIFEAFSNLPARSKIDNDCPIIGHHYIAWIEVVMN